MFVQRLVEGDLGKGGKAAGRQNPGGQQAKQTVATSNRHGRDYCAPEVITVCPLRLCAQASSPVPVSMGFSLP